MGPTPGTWVALTLEIGINLMEPEFFQAEAHEKRRRGRGEEVRSFGHKLGDSKASQD